MDEQTTTEVATQDSGVETTQPVEQPAEAVQDTTTEPISTDTPAADTPATEVTPNNTADINEWLTKKGIDPTSPEAIAKVAEMARNSEKAMHQKAAESAEARRQLTSSLQTQTDPSDLQGEVRGLKLTNMARDFVDRHPEVRGEPLTEFAQFVKETPYMETMAEGGVLSLDQIYAVYQASPAQADKLKAQGGQEALQKLATTQRAAAVEGSASSPAPSKPTPEDDFMKGFNNPF